MIGCSKYKTIPIYAQWSGIMRNFGKMFKKFRESRGLHLKSLELPIRIRIHSPCTFLTDIGF